MSTLHTVNKTAANNALESCLRVASSGDCVLLIEDGVYQAAKLAVHSQVPNLHLYALIDDVTARGINLPEAITPIDYAQFVDLVCQQQRSVSWF